MPVFGGKVHEIERRVGTYHSSCVYSCFRNSIMVTVTETREGYWGQQNMRSGEQQQTPKRLSKFCFLLTKMLCNQRSRQSGSCGSSVLQGKKWSTHLEIIQVMVLSSSRLVQFVTKQINSAFYVSIFFFFMKQDWWTRQFLMTFQVWILPLDSPPCSGLHIMQFSISHLWLIAFLLSMQS